MDFLASGLLDFWVLAAVLPFFLLRKATEIMI